VVPEPPSFVLRGDPRWPSIVRRDGGAEVIINRAPFRSISETAWNPAARLEEIERAGIELELQVVSPMPELFSYWAPPADARYFCSATNEWLAKFVGSGGGRFEALGIIPLQDETLALAQLEEVVDCGLRGVLVGGNVNGVPVCDQRYLPIFGAATDAGLAVLVHAFKPLYPCTHGPLSGRRSPCLTRSADHARIDRRRYRHHRSRWSDRR
jgi:aminocarboxymuconate-semialdehyde decarboxylase